ncbi:MAG: hypothetical protein CK548_01325 [Opitutia bacterium]|nr:MAG: hypothetical protein CK548_01325 [Opitutae bacterium]
MGYLHTLPRLIAWLAAHLTDPAWWPAVYNGSAFALTVALFFRIASPRLSLPGKPALLLSFVFISVACVYRTRPDTWDHDNLLNGDRYFHLSRLLLFWLLILEFASPHRAIAWTARTLVLVGFLVHLPMLLSPAPPNYHWAEHCDPIRRGTPANIKTLPEGWWIEYPGRSAPR